MQSSNQMCTTCCKNNVKCQKETKLGSDGKYHYQQLCDNCNEWSPESHYENICELTIVSKCCNTLVVKSIVHSTCV
jgi:hypothetical protein